MDNHSVKNRKGQVLEVLQGQCDGSTITVDSGTYTMPDATRTSNYIVVLPTDPGMKDPDSEITYKAPAGTERIIIKYTGLFETEDSNGIIEAQTIEKMETEIKKAPRANLYETEVREFKNFLSILKSK